MNLPDNAVQALIPPDYDIVRWVENNRRLDNSSAEIGLKRISRTPYLYPLFEWFLDEKIREIVIQKPAQIGITDWIVDLISWIAVNDPSPTALFLADQETSRKIMKLRIKPAFKELGLTILKKNPNQQQDATKFEIQLKNGFYLVVGWGSSISQTASMAFKRVFCDEINKPGYEVVKDEGDTLARIRERMETFGDSKFILLSTPTIDVGNITKEFDDADIQYDFACPCPFCGIFQPLIFDNVVWEGGHNASKTQIYYTAMYKCQYCKALWNGNDRIQAVLKGKAIARNESPLVDKVSYQLNRLDSLLKAEIIPRLAHNFIKSYNDPKKLQNFINSSLGLPWIPRISPDQDTMQKTIFACVRRNKKLALPENTIGIVAAIDVQQVGFWYRLRAICTDSSTYGIDEGFVTTWEALDSVIFARYDDLPVWRCLIDTGGGKSADSYISRTEETYLWIRKNQGRGVEIWGCKGSSHSMPTKIKIGNVIEKTPSGKPMPGGIRIVQINTDRCKDAVVHAITHTAESPSEPGGWYLHSETPEYYFQQMTAEEKRRDKRGIVEWKKIRSENHLFDCEVYINAAIDPEFFGGIKMLLKKRQRTEQKQTITQAIVQPKVTNNPIIRRY